MSSSPEIEQFEITDDDFATAFNPERKKFRMSKNQAIYGNILPCMNYVCKYMKSKYYEGIEQR